MFVDQVEIEAQAGDGGNGVATFRTEKYVPNGGPDGGDGGRGGSVVFEVDPNLSTLLDFRYKRHYKAPRGGDGGRKNCFGKDGEDLVLRVPPGTMVVDNETGETLADLKEPGERAVVLKGGRGGRGNQHFATAVFQAPKFAEKGEPGDHRHLRLELRLLADVGLLGYPSVGKSTIISAVSAARPKIAEYHFTTLVPNLGVVYVAESQSFVMADLPGLIEGAHEGIGLGLQFLRHVERSGLLLHVLDVSGVTGRDPLEDFRVINHELELYSETLAERPQIIALNKIDVADSEDVARIEAALQDEGLEIFRISAATRQGLEPLVYRLWEALKEARAQKAEELPEGTVHITAPRAVNRRHYEVHREPTGEWVVTGLGIERMVRVTDMNNDYAIARLQRILERSGVNRKLKEVGAEDGETVRIGAIEFEYSDDDIEREPEGLSRRRRKKKGQEEEVA